MKKFDFQGLGDGREGSKGVFKNSFLKNKTDQKPATQASSPLTEQQKADLNKTLFEKMYKVSIENKGFFGPQNPAQMRIDITAQAALSPSPPLLKDEIKPPKVLFPNLKIDRQINPVCGPLRNRYKSKKRDHSNEYIPITAKVETGDRLLINTFQSEEQPFQFEPQPLTSQKLENKVVLDKRLG